MRWILYIHCWLYFQKAPVFFLDTVNFSSLVKVTLAIDYFRMTCTIQTKGAFSFFNFHVFNMLNLFLNDVTGCELLWACFSGTVSYKSNERNNNVWTRTASIFKHIFKTARKDPDATSGFSLLEMHPFFQITCVGTWRFCI